MELFCWTQIFHITKYLTEKEIAHTQNEIERACDKELRLSKFDEQN